MNVQDLSIKTPDGLCAAKLFSGNSVGAGIGVIFYMDIFGPRQSLWDMAARLVENGYAVLVPDLFYRVGEYGPFNPATAFQDPDNRNKLLSMKNETTQTMTMADTGAFIEALDKAGCGEKIGTVGYCMGGPRAINAAVAYPERIAAAASFHGGDLASEAADSPVHGADRIRAKVYAGTANEDQSFPPEQAARFATTLLEKNCDFTLESYPGTSHGWCVADQSAYHEQGAARHWKRLLTLFEETL